MKTNRLLILMATMLALAFLRFSFPPKATTYATVEPVSPRAQLPRTTAAATPVVKDELASASDEDVPGNAFSVRVVAPPPVPAPPPPVVAPVVAVPAAPVLSAQELAAQAPVPFQVIGTYDDGGAPAVFVATALGALIARPGTVLLSDYRVTAITPQQVSLTQVSTQRAIQLPVPGGVAR